MRMKMFLILTAIVGGLAMLGAQGCFYRSHDPYQYSQQYGSSHTVCDAHGRNCMVCDADNRNCRRIDSQYGGRHTVCDSDGRNCRVCDADNRNCQRIDSHYQSNQNRSWGFWW